MVCVWWGDDEQTHSPVCSTACTARCTVHGADPPVLASRHLLHCRNERRAPMTQRGPGHPGWVSARTCPLNSRSCSWNPQTLRTEPARVRRGIGKSGKRWCSVDVGQQRPKNKVKEVSGVAQLLCISSTAPRHASRTSHIRPPRLILQHACREA